MAAGVVPQSSCSFRPMAPASICWLSASGRLALPLPRKPRFIGKASAACSMRWMFSGPGVQVVAKVPVAGPVPPPSMVVTPLQGLVDLLRADEVDVAVDAAGGDDHALAGNDLGARADDDVHARLHIGVAGLADGRDAAALDADVGLDDAPVVDDQRIGDHAVGARGAGAVDALALAHAVADGLAAAELDLFAVAAGRSVKSCSTSIISAVSARRTRSPVVGPYISA
jgi:hypothetical protein